MLLNFPVLFPQETLYSWYGHTHLNNGILDARRFSIALLDDPHAARLHDFPAHLETLARTTSGLLGEPTHLALRHTLLGYFLAGTSQDMAEKVLQRLMAGSDPHLKFNLGIPASRIGGYHPLKGCDECFREAESERGRSFWEIGHQLPCVFVCPKHQRPLRYVADPVTPVHRRTWILPSALTAGSWEEFSVQSSHVPQLARLAALSNAWAHAAPGSFSSIGLSKTYRTTLENRNLMTSKGSLRLSKLLREIHRRYDTFARLQGFHFVMASHEGWPGFLDSIARKHPTSAHPFKHILMIAMLFPDWGTFLDAYANRKPERCIANPEISIAGTDDRRTRFLQHIESGLSVTEAAARSGISTTTGVCWASAHGVEVKRRPKMRAQIAVEAAKRLLASGLGKVEIARTCNLSPTCLNRLLMSDPELARTRKESQQERSRSLNRARFNDAVRTHPLWTIRRIRTLSGNGYGWLYRNDKNWLQDQIRAHLRLNEAED